MRDLRVALVQSMLHWEDAAANRAMFTQKFASLKGTTDLVVLPEMFSTGFSMRSAELAEPMDGPTVTWMKEQAWEWMRRSWKRHHHRRRVLQPRSVREARRIAIL